MKKILTFALAAMVALSASAAKKKTAAKDANKPVFTIIKENPITTIKDQNRSGTCWDYSTLSFFEAEILKATGKKYRRLSVCTGRKCRGCASDAEDLWHLSYRRHAFPRLTLW